jgi:esterase/lipase
MWFIYLFLGIVILIILGPRVRIDTRIRTLSLPDDLDTWLDEKESAFPNLTPGTEKRILWAGRPGEKTPVSIIYIHGFSASRQETAPVFERVAETIGANLFYTRLTGHGLGGEALAGPTVNDWLNDIWEAWKIGRQIGERVVVVGTSMGGALAAWLCSQVKDAHVLVLLSPLFGSKDIRSRLVLWPWGAQIAKIMLGRYRSFEPENPAHAKYWTCRYPSESILPVIGVVRLSEFLPYRKMKIPVLGFYTDRDDTISLFRLNGVFRRLGSSMKRLVKLEEAEQHVLAGDILSPQTNDIVVREVTEFLAKVDRANGQG